MSQEKPPIPEKSLSELKRELVQSLTSDTSLAGNRAREVVLPRLADFILEGRQDKINETRDQYFKIYNIPKDVQDLIKETITLFTQENREAIILAKEAETHKKNQPIKIEKKVTQGTTQTTELKKELVDLEPKKRKETPLLTQSAEKLRNTPKIPKEKKLEEQGSKYIAKHQEEETLSDEVVKYLEEKDRQSNRQIWPRTNKFIDTLVSRAKKQTLEKKIEESKQKKLNKTITTPENVEQIDTEKEPEQPKIITPQEIHSLEITPTVTTLEPIDTLEGTYNWSDIATTHTYTANTTPKNPAENTPNIATKITPITMENKNTQEKKEYKKTIDQIIDDVLREPGVREKITKFFENARAKGITAVTHGGNYTIPEDITPKIEGGLSFKKGEKVLRPKTDFDGQVTGFLLNQFGIPVNEQRFVQTGTEFDIEDEQKGDLYFDVAENGKILSVIEDPKTGKIHITLGNHFEERDTKTSSADILYKVMKKVLGKENTLNTSNSSTIDYGHLEQEEGVTPSPDIEIINKKRAELGLEPFTLTDYSSVEKTPLDQKALEELIRFTNDTDNLMMPIALQQKYTQALTQTLYGHYHTLPFEKIVAHFASGKKATDPLPKEILQEIVHQKTGVAATEKEIQETRNKIEKDILSQKTAQPLTTEELKKAVDKTLLTYFDTRKNRIERHVANAETGIKNAEEEMTSWNMPEGAEGLGRILINDHKNSNIGTKEIVFTPAYGYDSLITFHDTGVSLSRPGKNIKDVYEKIVALYPEAILQNSQILCFPKKSTFDKRAFLHAIGIDYAETQKISTEVKRADLKKGLSFMSEIGTPVTIISIKNGFVTLEDPQKNTSTESIEHLLELINTGVFKETKKIEEVENKEVSLFKENDVYTNTQNGKKYTIVNSDEHHLYYTEEGKAEIEKVNIPYVEKMIAEGTFKKVEQETTLDQNTQTEPTVEQKTTESEPTIGPLANRDGLEKKLHTQLGWPIEILQYLKDSDLVKINIGEAGTNGILYSEGEHGTEFREKVRQYKIEKLKEEIEQAYERKQLRRKRQEELDRQLLEVRTKIAAYEKANTVQTTPEPNRQGEPEKISQPIELSTEDTSTTKQPEPQNTVQPKEGYIDFEKIKNSLTDPKFLQNLIQKNYNQIGMDKIEELMKIAGQANNKGTPGLVNAYITAKKTDTRPDLVTAMENMLRGLKDKK